MGSWEGRLGSLTMPPRVPYTRIIVDDVIEKIRTGVYQPGSKLPSIDEMRAHYECSAAPVKSALRELQIRGFTEGHQGLGTFVVSSPPIG